MTTRPKLFVDTTEAAELTGVCRSTMARACRDNPGFAIRLNGAYRIPTQHIERVLRGETPSQISASVRAGGDTRAA